MPLNSNVLVAEADVAARIGAVLVGTTYTVFGLTMTQAEFQTIINNQVNEEIGVLSSAVYNTTDAVTQGLVKSYQINDACYSILSGLAGRSATYFNFSAGDMRFDLQIGFLQEETSRLLKERDRSLNLVQQSTAGGTLVDTQQPSYGTTASSTY